MRSIVVLAVLLVACRGPGSGRPKAGRGAAPDATGTASPDGVPNPAAPVERCAGGEPWNGAPQGCAYEVDGCCYVDAEKACAAAKCEPTACEVLETHPAQVRCR